MFIYSMQFRKMYMLIKNSIEEDPYYDIYLLSSLQKTLPRLIFFLHSSYAWSRDINKPYKPMIKFLKFI